MWTRQQLKQRGKEAFKKNYWKTVLVSLILTVLIGGAGAGSAASGFSSGLNSGIASAANSSVISIKDDEDELIREQVEALKEASGGNLTDMQIMEVFEALGVDIPDELEDEFSVEFGEDGEFHMSSDDKKALGIIAVLSMGIFLVLFGLIFLVIFVISLAVDILLINPLQMGTYRFFLSNLNEQAKVKQVAFAFDHHYKNIVKTLFMRDLYVFLWSLLFIIPGIVKAYEYRMVPYLLCENPSMNFNEALVLSSKMMYGQKWRTFVLDLSFLGWNILSSLTSGILGIFYVAPYQNMTNAALFEALKQNVEIPQQQIVYGLNSGEQ